MSAGQPSALAYRYASALASSGFSADPAQRAAIDELERLRRELIATKKISLLTRLRRRFSAPEDHAGAVRGVYLWGSVGRGKTWLMDLFFESLPFPRKRRSHFHRFMQSVHEGLRHHRDEVDPLIAVATDIARDTRVLCLDELFVSDIADAMLLGGLFAHLVDRGVTLVFTSNVPPAGLYRNGLQRQRFLPAIALLERHCALVSVDGSTDYRLRQLTRMPIYLQSDSERTSNALTEMFEDLADGLGTTGGSIDVEGRKIEVLRVCDNVVWFDFRALCEGPRSQNDYVSIAREFQTVLLSNVPVFTAASEDAARRFIAVVDEFYDRRVNLVISAAAAPTQLYQGERLRFEFERTASRLIEMQSEEYLASEHRG
ncbi:MAG: AFG1 family ATPase [Gammaproteobacteria bacterium]|nr:AFG1 family ATPase [Gammaproteobacteria bacterium]MBM4224571.1 AFG1 family ATPase [Gammaproteobacteria bacterium]